MIYNKTEGLIAAPYTPMNEDGSINPSIIGRYADYLKERKIKGVFINGSTGETASLSLKERMILAEKWLNYQTNDFKIFVHVGSNSVIDSKELTKHAEENNAFAVGATGPSYFKPASEKILMKIMKDIASAGPNTPFYYYHIPALNSNYLNVVDFLSMSIDEIPTLSGMKYTYEDLMEFQLCRQLADGKLDILYGRDETLICGLALGVVGGVGSTYNFMAPLYLKIIESFNAGDLEKANILQVLSMRIIQQYGKYSGVPAGKVIMKQLGLDMGAPRLPFEAMSIDQENELIKELKNLDFFDYV